MTFQPSAKHKRSRWLVLLAIVAISTGVFATSVFAAPTFSFTADDGLANDEPGQKDLTAQASAIDPDNNDFYTAWKWDDNSWSGKNTGDGCSLFNTGGNADNVDYAVCVTVGGKSPTLQTVTVYSCTDGRVDRCTNPVLLATYTGTGSTTASPYCAITLGVDGPYDDPDTQATCNISLIDDALTAAVGLDAGTLLNTCSYPSREPNSDPSDCVITPTALNTSIATTPSGTATWSASLNDLAAMTPTTATGSVVFKLWATNTTGTCGGLIWTSASRALASGQATAHDADLTTATDAGSPTDGYIVTDATDNAYDDDEIYYWTVVYTPSGAFNTSSSACGETTTVTPASVSP